MPQPGDFQFDGVVRLTRVGGGYLVFTAVVGFAALNTGNNSLYIGLSFMLGCLLLSGLASKGGLTHLTVEFEGVDEAWAGRPAHGRLRVGNNSPIWNVRDVIIVSSELDRPVFLPIMPRKSEMTIDAQFRFERRGVAKLSRINLYTRYPFGLFLKKRRVRVNGELIVYPRLLEADIPRERFRVVDGDNTASNRAGYGTDVYGFRDYVRGDSLKQVHWRKSASIGRWIMKQTEAEAGRVVHVVIDPYLPPSVPEQDFENMISEAATFVHDALQRDLEVVMTFPSITLRGRAGVGGRAMFRALALVEPAREQVVLEIDRGATLFTARRLHEPQSA
jgi:uncharacterized protein (DUF58 family)